MMIDMKMTRYMLIPLALVAFAACAKVEREEAPATKVTFNVGSYAAQTKADSHGHLSLLDEEITSFRSMAFLHANGVSETQAFFGTTGETISWNSSAKEWAPSHPYYWPKSPNSYINFVSWYDKNAAATAKPSTITETNLAWTGRTIAVDDNIMYANEAWHYQQNAETHLLDGVTEGVPTLFHHALAQVKFQAKARTLTQDGAVSETNPATTYMVKIKSATLTPYYKKGSLALTNAEPAAGPNVVAWTYNATSAPLGWTVDTDATAQTMTGAELTLTTNLVPIPGMSSVVLPQSVENMALTLTYEISTSYDGGTSYYSVETPPAVTVPLYRPSSATNAATAFSNTISSWEMNKIYTYNIIIDPVTNVIIYSPTAVAWDGPIEGGLDIE